MQTHQAAMYTFVYISFSAAWAPLDTTYVNT